MKRMWTVLAVLCLLAGCAAPKAPVQETAAEPLSPVYTDWSHLTPQAAVEPLYTYAESYCGDGPLQAGADYGLLLPYVGSYLETDSYMGPLCTMGLVTTDGQLVTDAIYAQIEPVRDSFDSSTPSPFLMLYRGRLTGRYEDAWGSSWTEGEFDLTLAASDGRWVREMPPCYGAPSLLPGDRLGLALEDGSVIVLNAEGETVQTFSASSLEAYLGEGFAWNWEGGPYLNWYRGVGQVWRYDDSDPGGDGSVCWLDPDTGFVTEDPPPGWTEPVYEPEPGLTFPGYTGWSTFSDPATGKRYCYFCRTDDSGIYDLLDEQGHVVWENCGLSYPVLGISDWGCPWVWNDLIACSEDGAFCYYDPAGTCVFRYPVRTNLD